jgi:hypothetical protein
MARKVYFIVKTSFISIFDGETVGLDFIRIEFMISMTKDAMV